jgi:hypothetical protein
MISTVAKLAAEGHLLSRLWLAAENWSILTARAMKSSLQVAVAPGRMIGVWVCLVAVVLLWAPLWASAWQASGMACCNGNECPIHGHAGGKHSGKSQAAANKNAPMEFGHENRPGLMACRVSCCQDQSHSFVAAVTFLLPEPMTISVPVESATVVASSQAKIVAHLFEPPSPPPRVVSIA